MGCICYKRMYSEKEFIEWAKQIKELGYQTVIEIPKEYPFVIAWYYNKNSRSKNLVYRYIDLSE